VFEASIPPDPMAIRNRARIGLRCTLHVFVFAAVPMLASLSVCMPASAQTQPKPTPSCKREPPGNIYCDTEAKFAELWMEGPGAVALLDALEALTIHKDNPSIMTNRLYADLGQLKQDHPDFKTDRDMFLAAFGDPARDGTREVPPLVNLVVILARANKCDKNRLKVLFNKGGLLTQVLNDIYASNTGKEALIKANREFVVGDPNKCAALYELLKAERNRECKRSKRGAFDDEKCDNDPTEDALCNMQVLRAAFEQDKDELARRVAAYIEPKHHRRS
jgi:hypothetical protein